MSDFEREEQAFREALAEHAAAVPQDPVDVRRPRRSWLLTGAAAAAVVAVVVPIALTAGGGPGAAPDPAGPTSSSSSFEPTPITTWRRVAYGDVELDVPEAWSTTFGPARPDCVRGPRGAWGPNPTSVGYVELEPVERATTAQGCSPPPRPAGMAEEFGQLPFSAWRPYVHLGPASGTAGADQPDGSWAYRDWTLTRETVGATQVSVLTSPTTPRGTTEDILGSAHVVGVTSAGCETTSPVQATGFPVPSGPPVPAADRVSEVALCLYRRAGTSAPGLVGSTELDDAVARRLTAAIDAAPAGGGPDRPETCSPDDPGSQALVLHFRDAGDEEIGVAYVYFSTCFGNGIVDSDGSKQLTVDDCSPLFSEPPVVLWSASSSVAGRCYHPWQ